MPSRESDLPQVPRFATTRWSVVVSAGRKSSPDARQALENLCQDYWPPLYAYARRRVASIDEAQDLTQAFFAELLEKNYLGAAVRERGRFRAFLITAFKHYLSKQWEKNRAQKRGGGRPVLSLDFQRADSTIRIEPASHVTPEQYYDQQWALGLLDRILASLQSEYTSKGKGDLFGELKGFLIGEHGGTTLADAAERLAMSEPAVRQAATRLRRRYRELLRDEILQTVEGPEQVDDEIRKLFQTLRL